MKQIKQKYLLLPLLLVVMIQLHGQEAAILDSEAQRFKAQVEQNTDALQLLLHDDLYYLHSNGLVETKADFITSVQSGKITYQEMYPVESRLRRFGKTAVVTGLVKVRGLYKGQSFNIGLYYTSVYRKERGRWQLLNWQSTRQPDDN